MTNEPTIVITLFKQKLESFEQKINLASNNLEGLKEALTKAQHQSNTSLTTLIEQSCPKGSKNVVDEDLDDGDDSEEETPVTGETKKNLLKHPAKIQKTK